MQKKNISFGRAALFALILNLWPELAFAEIEFYYWVRPSQAEYFVGSFENDHQQVKFRTSMRWVLLPSECKVVELTAYDTFDRPISQVKASHISATNLRLRSHKKPPNNEPNSDYVQNSPTGIDDEEDYWGPQEGDEDPYAKDSGKAGKSIEKPVRRITTLSIQLGLGKESLDAKGGVTVFSGDSAIGSTRMTAYHNFNAKIFVTGELEGHSFVAASSKSIGEEQKDQKFLRVYGASRVSYDLLASSENSWRIAPGIGVIYNQIPILKNIDADTGVTTLGKDGFLALQTSLIVGKAINQANVVNAEFALAPITLSSGSFEEQKVSLVFVHEWRPNLYINLGLSRQSFKSTIKLSCGDLDSCETKSVTQSKVTAGYLGGGISF